MIERGLQKDIFQFVLSLRLQTLDASMEQAQWMERGVVVLVERDLPPSASFGEKFQRQMTGDRPLGRGTRDLHGSVLRAVVTPRAPAEAYPARAQTRRMHKVPPGTHKASTTTKRKESETHPTSN